MIDATPQYGGGLATKVGPIVTDPSEGSRRCYDRATKRNLYGHDVGRKTAVGGELRRTGRKRNLRGLTTVLVGLFFVGVLASDVQMAASAAPQGPWLPFTRLSNPAEGAASPQVGVDPEGTTISAWYRSNGLIQTATRPAGGSWTPGIDLPASGAEAGGPRLAITENGTAVLVWKRINVSNKVVISAAVRDPGENFSAPIDISAAVSRDPDGLSIFDGLDIAVAGDGTATVAWVRRDEAARIVEFSTRTPAGDFSSPVTVSASEGSAAGLDIAGASDGTATIVWSWRENTPDALTVVQAVTRTPGGSFGSPVDLEAPAGAVLGSPAIAVAADSTTTIVWSRGDYDVPGNPPKAIQAVTRPPGGSFGPAVELPGSRPEGGVPQIAFSPDGSATVVWGWVAADTSAYAIKAATRIPGGSFGTPIKISPDAQVFGSPSIAVAGDGTATVVSTRTDGPNTIYATTRPAGGSFGPQVRVSGAGTGTDAGSDQLAVSPDGTATVVWYRRNVSQPFDTRIESASTQTPSFSLAVTKKGSGIGTVSSTPTGIDCGLICSGTFTSFARVTLNAVPAIGSRFVGWSGAGCSGTGSCRITLETDVQAAASFEADMTPPPPEPSIATIDKVSVRGAVKLRRGKKSTFTVKVTNSGDAEAAGTKLAVSGRGIRASTSIGKVAANQSRSVRIKLKPTKLGRTRLSFKVTSSNAGGRTVKKTITVKK